MKILIFEYITGGGRIKESIPASLAQEGELMLGALIEDLAAIDGCRMIVMRDARLEPPCVSLLNGALEIVRIGPEDEFDETWKAMVRRVDAVWPIAPETGGILEKLCTDVRAGGKILLNSPATAVAQTASKLQTLSHLQQCGIDVVPTVKLLDFRDQFSGPWVVKPDDGVGCEAMRMVRNKEELKRLQEMLSAKNVIIQPFVEGAAMSLSALFKRGNARLLSCNQQIITIRDNFFSLSGCIVNVVSADRTIFSDLACSIARAIPDLFGYAGVDLILADGRAEVLEINPRLTTSYAALSRALNRNVAAMVLDLLPRGSELPASIDSTGSSVRLSLEETDDS